MDGGGGSSWQADSVACCPHVYAAQPLLPTPRARPSSACLSVCLSAQMLRTSPARPAASRRLACLCACCRVQCCSSLTACLSTCSRVLTWRCSRQKRQQQQQLGVEVVTLCNSVSCRRQQPAVSATSATSSSHTRQSLTACTTHCLCWRTSSQTQHASRL